MIERATLEQAEVEAKRLGRKIGSHMPKGWGFALVMFSFGESGFSTYISNACRTDMIKALRECAESLEGKKEI